MSDAKDLFIVRHCDIWGDSVKIDYKRCYTEFFLYNE